jgi:hypothetical protein
MEEEIWKPVPSYPGLMASSWGRVKLPDGEAPLPNGGIRKYFPKPTYGTKTKSSKTARHHYYGMFNRRYGNIKIHRAVCEAFYGPPPIDKPYVLHLDENALNNRPENLRWGSQKENLNASGFIEYCKSRIGENSPVIKGRKAKS